MTKVTSGKLVAVRVVAGFIALVALLPGWAAGCGSDSPPPPLKRDLLPVRQMPAAVPSLKEAVNDAGPSGYLRVVGPDRDSDLRRATAALRQAGFKRGSARLFSSRGRGGKEAAIFAVRQGVAELGGSGQAKEVIDQTTKGIGAKPGSGEIELKLGDYSKSYRQLVGSKSAPLYVYTFQWQRDDLAFYLSVIPNPNSAYSPQRAGVTITRPMRRLAKKASSYAPID